MNTKKKEALDQIRKARTAHKRWMSYARAIHMGLPVDKKAVPMIETDCTFGQWYYGPGQAFTSLESYQAIEEPHTMLHQLYMQIYKLRRTQPKGGLFTSKKSAEKKKQSELENLMNQLQMTSEMLMEALQHLEEDIQNMNEFELQNMQ